MFKDVQNFLRPSITGNQESFMNNILALICQNENSVQALEKNITCT